MNFDVSFLPKAEIEYIKAYKWYEEQLEGLGERFSMAVEKQLNKIVKNPYHYPLKKRNCQECKIQLFPYIIVYKVYSDANNIVIISVFHTSRNPKMKYRK